MKSEDDLSEAERGKFYREDAELRLPIDFDAESQARLERLARNSGKDIGEMVNTRDGERPGR